MVGDVEPYQRRKLWLLNGPHSALAYAGLLARCETVAEATAHPVVTPFVRGLVDDILDVAEVPDAWEFTDEALQRFANPELGHTCRQVGADGSRKLAQRLLPVVDTRTHLGLPTTRFAVVVALWLGGRDRSADVRASCCPTSTTPMPKRFGPTSVIGDPSSRVCSVPR